VFAGRAGSDANWDQYHVGLRHSVPRGWFQHQARPADAVFHFLCVFAPGKPPKPTQQTGRRFALLLRWLGSKARETLAVFSMVERYILELKPHAINSDDADDFSRSRQRSLSRGKFHIHLDHRSDWEGLVCTNHYAIEAHVECPAHGSLLTHLHGTLQVAFTRSRMRIEACCESEVVRDLISADSKTSRISSQINGSSSTTRIPFAK